ncbi:winged helix-turn-helix transcriptional regulator [Flavobacterium sp.]|uniref:winged helix-turn-helix transcriptional regulator n=1 Tax=Flavobacterium sp. TaxID=239 RepID=UPI0039E579C7
MTTKKEDAHSQHCPAEGVLKLLSGKWKPQIFRLAVDGPVRFSGLLREIEGSNKQSIAVALKELEAEGLLEKIVIRLKPLHIEYVLAERGKAMLSVFNLMEQLK